MGDKGHALRDRAEDGDVPYAPRQGADIIRLVATASTRYGNLGLILEEALCHVSGISSIGASDSDRICIGGASMDNNYLMLSPELRSLLVQNGITLQDIVKEAGVTLLNQTVDPTIPPGTRADPVTLLIASAAVVAAATPLIQRILMTLIHRPIVVTQRELAPVLDGNGAAVTDQSGVPVLAWREKHELLESKSIQENTRVTVKGFGVEIGLG